MAKRALVPVLFGAVVACGSGSNGAAGESSLVVTTTEPPGSNCTNGGIKIEVGEDTNGNGVLDPNEITETKYVCNGTDGTNGTNGTNGANGTNGMNGVSDLVSASTEAPGANCAEGGVKIESGADTNGNGMLDAGEVTSTKYVCNGIPTLVSTSTEPAGANCAAGGTKIEIGPDTNGNGTLDAGEVVATSYVCNGTSSSSGTTPAVTAYNAGSVLASTAGTSVTVQSASLTVPGAGTIVAIASADVFCQSPATGGGYDCVASGTTDGSMTIATSATAGAMTGDYDYFYLTPNDTESMTRTAVIPVTTAGTYTSYFLGEALAGQMGYFRPQLTLLFIPD